MLFSPLSYLSSLYLSFLPNRLYTQLEYLKNKSLCQGNPHISKRRGGRKVAHRRFSLQVIIIILKHVLITLHSLLCIYLSHNPPQKPSHLLSLFSFFYRTTAPSCFRYVTHFSLAREWNKKKDINWIIFHRHRAWLCQCIQPLSQDIFSFYHLRTLILPHTLSLSLLSLGVN